MGIFEAFQALSPARQSAFVTQATADAALAGAVLPSAVQQRILFLSALEGGAAAYNLPYAGRIRGPVVLGALRQSFQDVLRRHEQLRRRFVHAGDRLLSLVSDDRSASPVEHYRCPGLGNDARDRDARRRARSDAARPFKVIGGSLVRLITVEYASDDHLILLTVHHTVADGWSLGLLYRELAIRYDAHLAGDGAPSAAATPAGYDDYVRHEQAAATDGSRDRALANWASMLAGAPASIDLPADFVRPPTQNFRGANAERVLSLGTSDAVRAIGAAGSVTPFMTCLALFGLTLSRYSGARDVVVGTPVSGRPSANFDGVVGMFVNTIPVRLTLPTRGTLESAIRTTRAACLRAFEIQEVPLNVIVDHIARPRDLGRPPLFQTSFAFVGRDAADPVLRLGDVEAEPVDVPGCTAKFELSLTVHERADGRLNLVLEYATALFDVRTVDRILATFDALAGACLRPTIDPRDVALPTRPPVERPQELTHVPRSDAVSLLDLVTTSAEAYPNAVAVRSGDEHYTYERLLGDAHRLADVLLTQGVGPGSRVGIMLERTPRLLVSMLAVFAAGGSYVPLDPTYPGSRLSFMLEDSHCVALLADRASTPDGMSVTLPIVDPAVQITSPPRRRTTPPGPAAEAYVLYTSGSTGIPKGVSVPHAAVLAMVDATWQIFGPECLRQSLAATSASFDVSTIELFPTLGLGGTVHLVPSLFETPSTRADARPTFTAGVPSLLAAALEAGTLDVSGMVVAAGGEPLRGDLVRQLYAAGAACVANIYGPTEDCTYSTSALIPPGCERPPIGQSIPGGRAYVLDGEGYALPLGAVGEIYLAGTGLAGGYVERPSLTAARFVPDPFADRPGERMYRTGDLGHFRPDGELEYVGRVDRQVKINGMRIELGEVESALLQIDGIVRCVAVVQTHAGHARLGAIVESRLSVDVTDVRRPLLETLPRHLIPAVLVQVERIPLLPNGKVDSDAVLAALLPARSNVDVLPDRTPSPVMSATAEVVCRLWRTLLPGSDAEGDFFDEGGNSLSALRLALLIRDELGVRFDIADVFMARTVMKMAQVVEGSTAVVRGVPRAHDDERRTALSREQFRLWFIEQVSEPGAAYLIPLGWELSGPLDVTVLARAVEDLQTMHAALRLRIHEVDGEPRTFDGGVCPLVVVDDPGAGADEELIARFAEFALTPLDLDGGPLFTARLLRMAPDHHALMIAVHHIVADGWSVGVIEEDLTALCRSTSPEALEGSGAEFVDHVVRQAELLASPEMNEAVEHWRALLDGAPTVLTTATRASSVEHSFRGSSERFLLTERTSTALGRLAGDFDVTPFVASSLVYGLTLMELAHVDDVLVGTPVTGRYDHALERTVGMFANTLVLRLDARGNPSVKELVGRYRSFVEAAYSLQDVPLDAVVEVMSPVRSSTHSTLFQVLFSYDYGFGDGFSVQGTSVRPLDYPGTSSKFDLSATVGRDQREFAYLTIEYSTDLFTAEDVRRLVGVFELIAVSIAHRNDLTVHDHLWMSRDRIQEVQ